MTKSIKLKYNKLKSKFFRILFYLWCFRFSSSKKQTIPDENRSKNLQHVREQLDELEQIVTYYQLDLMNQQEEETTVYEEAQIQADDVEHLKKLIMQQKQLTPPATANNNDNTAKPLDKLSNELAAKRL